MSSVQIDANSSNSIHLPYLEGIYCLPYEIGSGVDKWRFNIGFPTKNVIICLGKV